MANKTLEQRHAELIQRYNRGEGQRAWRYKGYTKDTLLMQLGYGKDVLTINPDDSKAEIRAKNNALRDLLDGNKRLIEIPHTTKQERYMSERRIKEADRKQSQINYENFKLYKASISANEVYRTRNATGEKIYKKADYRNNQMGVEMPQVPGLPHSKTFFIKGTNIEIGTRVPNTLSAEDKIAYESYIYDLSLTEKHEISSNKQTKNYKRLFKGGEYKVKKEDRLKVYKKNITKALTGAKSVYRSTKSTNNKKLARIRNKLNKMSEKDFLILTMQHSNIYTFEYMYSEKDIDNRLDSIESQIDRFNQIKNDKDKSSVEYQQYQKTIKSLGSYYD